MDPEDFLGVADAMCESTVEAERRTAVGRYYYAVFNHCRSLVEAGGKAFPSDVEAHGCLRQYMTGIEQRIREMKGASQILSNLRAARNDADYEMRIVVSVQTSQTARGRAKRLLEMVKTVPTTRLNGAISALPTCVARPKDS